jgi:hypothetical protein
MTAQHLHSASISHLETALEHHRSAAQYELDRLEHYIRSMKEAQAKYDEAFLAAQSIELTIKELRAVSDAG